MNFYLHSEILAFVFKPQKNMWKNATWIMKKVTVCTVLGHFGMQTKSVPQNIRRIRQRTEDSFLTYKDLD